MPELLPEGFPDRAGRSKFDFSKWADGRSWKFVKGTDYDSSTETFRTNVRRWAKLNDYEVELRPYPAQDREGRAVPLIKTDAIGLGVKFTPNGNRTARANGAVAPENAHAAGV